MNQLSCFSQLANNPGTIISSRKMKLFLVYFLISVVIAAIQAAIPRGGMIAATDYSRYSRMKSKNKEITTPTHSIQKAVPKNVISLPNRFKAAFVAGAGAIITNVAKILPK